MIMTETSDYETGEDKATYERCRGLAATAGYCGSDSLPPCPKNAFYVERNELIYQLAGPRPSKERLRKVAAQVDDFLVTVLRGARMLDETTHLPRRCSEPEGEHRPSWSRAP
jgi:hypothetical protein